MKEARGHASFEPSDHELKRELISIARRMQEHGRIDGWWTDGGLMLVGQYGVREGFIREKKDKSGKRLHVLTLKFYDLLKLCNDHDDCLDNEALGRSCFEQAKAQTAETAETARTPMAQHLAFLCVEHDDCLANETLGLRCWETQAQEKWEAFAKLMIPCSQCGNQPSGCFCT